MPTDILTVYTVSEEFNFKGKDCEVVYKSINDAASIGALWTTPTELSNGEKIIFVLSNIIVIGFS